MVEEEPVTKGSGEGDSEIEGEEDLAVACKDTLGAALGSCLRHFSVRVFTKKYLA